MNTFGQQPAGDADRLEAQHKATWAAYSGLQPAPGWQQQSIDHATAAARAKLALDRANGYMR